MSVDISFRLENCDQCRHQGHSGSFTPGGAKQICQGPNVIEHVARHKGIVAHPKYIKHLNGRGTKEQQEAARNYIHWKHRVLKDPSNSIPPWCPLKHGERY